MLSCSAGDGISGGVYVHKYVMMVFSFIQQSLIQWCLSNEVSVCKWSSLALVIWYGIQTNMKDIKHGGQAYLNDLILTAFADIKLDPYLAQ